MKQFLLSSLILLSLEGFSQSFIFVFLHKKTDAEKITKEQSDKIMEGHMANINRLATEGKLIAAGPFDGGGGIFIFKSTSQDEVKVWLETDPGVKAKRWNVEILPYQPRYRSVCAVSEPYEMVSYQFVHYIANLTKDNIQDAAASFKDHDEHLKKFIEAGNVITEAQFGDRDGGILVLKGDLPQVEIEKDPAVASGLLQVQLKKLWIAKGAFCEK